MAHHPFSFILQRLHCNVLLKSIPFFNKNNHQSGRDEVPQNWSSLIKFEVAQKQVISAQRAGPGKQESPVPQEAVKPAAGQEALREFLLPLLQALVHIVCVCMYVCV